VNLKVANGEITVCTEGTTEHSRAAASETDQKSAGGQQGKEIVKKGQQIRDNGRSYKEQKRAGKKRSRSEKTGKQKGRQRKSKMP